MLSDSCTVFKLTQLSKACAPILVTLSGIVISVRYQQFAKSIIADFRHALRNADFRSSPSP